MFLISSGDGVITFLFTSLNTGGFEPTQGFFSALFSNGSDGPDGNDYCDILKPTKQMYNLEPFGYTLKFIPQAATDPSEQSARLW